MRKSKALLFEMSRSGRQGYSLPSCDVPVKPLEQIVPHSLQRSSDLDLPELSEVEVIRHYTELSTRNFGVDTGFYPLGSCTMKYNPKVNEEAAMLPGFAYMHPCQPEETAQGALELLYNMEQDLIELTGMDRFTLQPAAGAHGELTGLMLIQAYHRSRGDNKRNKVLIPLSAHGTNPATVSMAGYEVVQIPCDDRGLVDLEALKAVVDETTSALMLTNPSTLGLFEEEIVAIAKAIHEAGGLLYYDGANMNAIMGYTRPGDMGFDVVHLNIHKTFATPHGGGGPGGGPVGVKERLIPFLPVPLVEKNDNQFSFNYDLPDSIGKIHSFYGNFGVVIKAYTYLKMMGAQGLKQASGDAVLNANYLMNLLKKTYYLPYDRYCKHEFVLSARPEKKKGAGAGDIAKALLDRGFHPPTVYFPLIVEEALMIEPTETESKETLDAFAKTMEDIAKDIDRDAEKVAHGPYNTVVGRLDEVRAARNPILRWTKK
ncbi:MAG: aminomethyl-transferring glycine dehydrogenase subunit GcvPB [Bacillota bacterium]|nr:aminomethyl-transferring glycine dehydrogenase subunit GcvPB [Bacillota bacterium]MDW7729836.1 aminomethyl-transferring glycine dehydrogenase subunit GcvPB [Bacillota bacterium]